LPRGPFAEFGAGTAEFRRLLRGGASSSTGSRASHEDLAADEVAWARWGEEANWFSRWLIGIATAAAAAAGGASTACRKVCRATSA